jgi:ribosomal protein S18 acetylase RimI-like enzyme
MVRSVCARSRTGEVRDSFFRMTSGALSTLTIRRASTADAATLATLGETTFTDTFGPENTPGDMAAYLATAFGEAIQRAELADARRTVFLAELGGKAVGYAVLRAGEAPACVRDGDGDAIEIERLYAATRLIGSGIGAALMGRCLSEARDRGRTTIWLGVWERNARAIAFYRRWQFADVGSHGFTLGADRQTDRVMARPVTGLP